MANPESSQHPDLQDLVAYLQGRGDETLRAQVLKRLDEDESYLELMVDLVPMLRAEGELADPDAEDEDDRVAGPSPPPAPAAAVLPFVAPPPSVTSSPLPANSAAPTRARRWPAALAALLPIAVGLWVVFQSHNPTPHQLAAMMTSKVKADQLGGDSLWEPRTRGEKIESPWIDEDKYLMAGGQIFALEIAVNQHDIASAHDRMSGLESILGTELSWVYFPSAELLKKPELSQEEWASLGQTMDSAYNELIDTPDRKQAKSLLSEGACWRAAWLAAKQQGPTLPNSCSNLLGATISGANADQLEVLLQHRLDELP